MDLSLEITMQSYKLFFISCWLSRISVDIWDDLGTFYTFRKGKCGDVRVQIGVQSREKSFFAMDMRCLEGGEKYRKKGLGVLLEAFFEKKTALFVTLLRFCLFSVFFYDFYNWLVYCLLEKKIDWGLGVSLQLTVWQFKKWIPPFLFFLFSYSFFII